MKQFVSAEDLNEIQLVIINMTVKVNRIEEIEFHVN